MLSFDELIFYIQLLGTFFFIASFLSGIILYKKYRSKLILFTTLGYFEISLWIYLLIIGNHIDHILGEYFSPIIAFLVLLSGQTIIYSFYSISKKYLVLIKGSLTLGWIIFGIVITEFFHVEARFFQVDLISNVTIVLLEPIYSMISLVYALLIFYLLWNADLNPLNKQRQNNAIAFLNLIMGLFGFITLFYDSILSFFISDVNTILILKLVGEFGLLLSIFILILDFQFNPEELIVKSRGLNHPFLKKNMSFALFGFGNKGTSIICYQGFNFLNENQKQKYLYELGTSVIVSLGRGEQYLEGSIVSMVPSYPEYSAISLSNWIDDRTQEDVRLNKKSYIILFISIPKHFEWILKRKHWELSFKKFISSFHDLSEINEKKLEDFIMSHLTKFAYEI